MNEITVSAQADDVSPRRDPRRRRPLHRAPGSFCSQRWRGRSAGSLPRSFSRWPCSRYALARLVPATPGRRTRVRRSRDRYGSRVEREMMTWDDLGTGSRSSPRRCSPMTGSPISSSVLARRTAHRRCLAYSLGVKNTATISVEFYTGIDERLELPMLLPRARPDRPRLGARAHRRRCGRHGCDARARARLLRGSGGRRASPCSSRSHARPLRASTSGAAPIAG